MSDIARRVAQLSPERQKLLMQQISGKREQASQTQIRSYKRESNIFPLSYAQQRLWFLDQLNPGTTAYLSSSTLHFHERLNAQVLERTLFEITRRHEILRTTFHERNGQPIQIIHPVGAFHLTSVDLSGLELHVCEREAQRLCEQEKQQACDLAHGPLLRLTLIYSSEREYVLLLTMHHIISDGWSKDVLLREAGVIYQALITGQPSPLQPLPIQYVDYTLWQRQWLQGDILAAQIAYWKHQLDGSTPLELPLDHPRPAIQAFDGAILSTQLPSSLQKSLLTLCQSQEATLFMVLLAAFQILLARYSGQDNISVGTPIANRTRPELEGLIGFFINTLIMRTDLSRNPTFLELLGRVREVALAAYTHQDVPFEQLVGELQPERDLSLSPLFQVMFNMQQKLTREPQASNQNGLNFGEPVSEITMTKFDLTLTVANDAHGLRCEFEYNTALFDTETIRRLARHWQRLLEGIVSSPETRLADLSVLTVEEQQCLLSQWNATTVSLPEKLFFHHLVAEQAQLQADAVALVYEDHYLTYSVLDYLSNCLAIALQRRDVGPDVLVGLWLPRSLELVVGLLAILKAGGAYVPLDPDLPTERFSLLQQEAQFSLVITTQEVVQSFSDNQGSSESNPTDIQALYLDEVWAEMIEYHEPLHDTHLSGEHLAYVLYTSGSTGVPKGVMVTHAGLLNYLYWCRYQYGLQSGWGTICHSSLGFDLTVTSLLAPLTMGQCVILLSEKRGLEELVQRVRLVGYGLSLLKVTPAHLELLEQLLEEDELQKVAHALIIGGEALTTEHIAHWRQKAPQVRLINEYGPTEAVVGCCVYEVLRDDPVYGSVPIGHPIINTQLYILDKYLQPVPIGVAGELYIAGAGLTRGYLNRADITAERFIAHPWSSEPGARLYRSGDIVRYRADGVIEYLGRNDQQVKLRGYRIELGEIVAALRQHSDVQDAVVQLLQASSMTPYLVGYIVTKQAQKIEHQELKAFLHRYVPEYMIPTKFVWLEELPITPNGKVDRARLPSVVLQPDEMQISLNPRQPLEQIIVEIWEDLLAVTISDVHENFFVLGGHSLLAARVISRIRTLLNVELPLRSLFEEPTIAGLARRVQQALQGEQALELPPLVAHTRQEDLPLSFAQQRLWFLDQLEPGRSVYLNPMAQQLHGDWQVEVLERSLREVIQRHESLRTHFQVRDGQPVQVIGTVPSSALTLIDLSGLPPDQQKPTGSRLAREEAGQPCDLQQGPLLRLHLLRMQAQEHLLLITMHHIITDGWSDEIFAREVLRLYRAFAAGQPSPLAPLPLQYADYACWQRQWMQGEHWQQHLNYWQDQLRGVMPLDLPTDHPRPSQQRFRGARLPVQLPASLLTELKALSQREGVTLFMTLLAAFQVLLARYSGQRDISVGTPSANRSHTEVESLIGFFVNTLVLRTDLSGHPSFRQVLQRVREVALGAYAHQEVPFEHLVEAVQPERDLSRNPLFQVMLIFQNLPLANEEPEAGLQIRQQAVDGGTARFDLTLSLNESQAGLLGILEYSTDLFDAASMRRLLENWPVLLQGLLACPDADIFTRPLVSAWEYEQQLHSWNGVSRELPAPALVHRLIEEQVARTPEAMALSAGEEQMSYGYVNAQANALGQALRACGVTLEESVALYCERGLPFVIAQLGIWKANGVYVPLDVLFPAVRVQQMLLQSHCRVVMVSRQEESRMRTLLQALSPEERPRVLVLEEVLAQGGRAENLPSRLQEKSLAYVIYTSGSTGQPKGVMVEQVGMLNHMLGKLSDLHMSARDVLAQNGPPCFDISVWQSLAPLLIGGRVELLRDEEALHPERLLEQVQRRGITVLQLVPALLRELLHAATQASGQAAALPALLWVVPTGDALPAELCRRWLQAYGEIPLLNTYGSTECSDDQCHWVVATTEGEAEWTPVMSIGTPLANLCGYVLDAYHELVPIGVAGELYLGGIGVGRGYLDDPVRTAQAFVPDRWSGQAGGRLYKTGDRVRWDGQGRLEFLGRGDHLVKVRGNRIELGEIEAVLEQHEQVQASVVVVHNSSGSGQPMLVAYVVSSQGLESQEFRQYLRERVPEYMVPAQVLLLDALPLTANGKVDRHALPAPSQDSRDDGYILNLPRTPIEELLAEAWRDMLGHAHVDVYDNFFSLGGNSLLATRIIAHLRTTLQIELPLRSLFEEPTIAGLARRVQQALQGEQALELPPLVAHARQEDLPLSFAQQRLWFLDQLEPGRSIYLNPMAQQLHGDWQVEVLERSLREVIQRHESLHTHFQVRDGQPVQVIGTVPSSVLTLIDLSGLPPDQQKPTGSLLAREEAGQPCDLQQGPLLRLHLLRMQAQEHLLLITMHHIITDGWSDEIFAREVLRLYRALAAGQPSPLAPLPLQYADYACWQRQWMQGEHWQQHLNYWQDQLRGVVPLDLPTDHPRPSQQHFRGTHLPVQLPASLLTELKALSQREGVTLFMTLLAAFQVLLARYSGQRDISVGTPSANRSHTEVEGLIGFFVNTLVLRTDLSGHPSFRQVLQRVREVTLGAYAHQEVPFEHLVEAVQPERDLSRNPLFQVMLIFQNLPPANEEPEAGLQIRQQAVDGGTARFDLTLSLNESQAGLFGILEYSTDLFDAATMQRLLENWQVLLQGLLACPDADIFTRPLVSAWEYEQQLHSWNGVSRELPVPALVHRLIEEQVARTPEAMALSAGEEQMSYRYVNAQANALGQALRACGVTLEESVALYCERGLPFVIAQLGIWKANGVYVPLDVLFPTVRVQQMLLQSHCRVVMVSRQEESRMRTLLQALPSEERPRVLVLEEVLAQGGRAENLPSRLQEKSLAYVIYTSGSTGQPKGVMVEQVGMLNHMLGKLSDLHMSARDVLAQNGPPCFDISVWQSLAPLLIGGRVELLRDEEALHPERLLEQVQRRGITVLQLVPVLLRELLHAATQASGQAAALPALRWVVPTGDALPAELCRRWLQAYGEIPLLNTYGSTECSDDQCHWVVTTLEGEAEWTPVMSIGTPLENLCGYVLDAYHELVPIGVAGELYLGGIGVGRGYLDDPARTAQAFVPDRWSGQAGGRLYKTGDRVRWDGQGRLEFLGRGDHLVKVRGNRIELGEIEAVLEQHEQVQASVVVVHNSSGGGQPMLVAYVVGSQGLESQEFRQYLRERVPEYMVPAQVLLLDALPLTANGKVDRHALPTPDKEQFGDERFVTPRTPAEEVVADYWKEILGRPEIGVYDDFFMIGGHSLLATRIISRLSSAFQVELSLRSLFENHTIDGLVTEIARLHGGRDIVEEIALVLKEIEQLTEDEIGEHFL